MSDVDSAKSVKLEKQVLELWDRLYQAWMSTEDGHGPKVTQAAVESSWNAFLDDIKKSPGKSLLTSVFISKTVNFTQFSHRNKNFLQKCICMF